MFRKYIVGFSKCYSQRQNFFCTTLIWFIGVAETLGTLSRFRVFSKIALRTRICARQCDEKNTRSLGSGFEKVIPKILKQLIHV